MRYVVKAGHRWRLTVLFLSVLVVLTSLVLVEARQPHQKPGNPKYPDISEGEGRTRGEEAADKLTPELRILFGQYSRTRGGEPDKLSFSDDQLRKLFGIREPGSANPSVNVAVRIAADGTTADLKKNGAKIYFRAGDLVFARTTVLSLERIAKERSVLAINTAKSVTVPPVPKPVRAPELESMTRGGTRETPPKLDNDFSSQRLTGKGVIVGIIDTGIDWQHLDFRKPDGSSRILYLWDMTDDSYESSGGRVGTSPPILERGGDPGPGTVYTNEQINAALRGQGTVNSMDHFGHGTAAAGTAAGNGRATGKGIPEGTFKGVAPEADLVIVKAGDCGGFDGSYLMGTYWITLLARSRNQPAVINHSLGGHISAHDGSEPEERVMNSLTGAGKPGIVFTVSAGNEGEFSMHASGRFGPRIEGQADIEGSPIEVSVSAQRTEDVTWINGYFQTDEDWGLAIKGSGDFLVDEKGQPFVVYIFKVGRELRVGLPKGVKKPPYFNDFAQVILNKTQLAKSGDKLDRLWLPLKPGNYYLWGFGPTARVQRGNFDLYLPFYSQAGFTLGAQKTRMIGSPGNAANVVTVGSYDFRGTWDNVDGGRTLYNLALSDISEYSSPGGLGAEGGFKPEITAPARYTISSLSAAALPGSASCEGESMGAEAGTTSITPDGKHIAWSGTSAAAPYTAGVIALMLQKNPNLDAKQIKDILIKTAIKGDRHVGAVPNAEWGFGKINPGAAIAATPIAGKRPIRKTRASGL